MKPFSLSTLKQHPALIPLYVSVGLGVGGGLLFGLRVALRNPDIAWVRKQDPGHSNEEYADKQYKLYSPSMDYSQIKSPAPKY